jgi:nucleoside-diphosphate-sugar epimerase
VIFGASGFLGRLLLAHGSFSMPVKAVARTIPRDAPLARPGVQWLVGDLRDRDSIDEVVKSGDVVINLAYTPTGGLEANVDLVANLVDACLHAGVARLVHCSTANVVGSAHASVVTEEVPCAPLTPYENTKWKIEQRVADGVSKGLDAAILRPTAIVGPGGENLQSLAASFTTQGSMLQYLRSCLFGTRPMHLVPARDVAAALLHLAALPGRLEGEVYYISADDDPDNNFQRVEAILANAMGVRRSHVPTIFLPRIVLALALRLRRRSETNLDRVYSPTKLRATGFRPTESIADAVRAFGQSLR